MTTMNGPGKNAPARAPQQADRPMPLHQVTLGRIRQNEMEIGRRLDVQGCWLSKDNAENWKNSTSFGPERSSIPAKVADQVLIWSSQNPASYETLPQTEETR